MKQEGKMELIRAIDEAFEDIPAKERGYILGYAQAVKDQTERRREEEDKETA